MTKLEKELLLVVKRYQDYAEQMSFTDKDKGWAILANELMRVIIKAEGK